MDAADAKFYSPIGLIIEGCGAGSYRYLGNLLGNPTPTNPNPPTPNL